MMSLKKILIAILSIISNLLLILLLFYFFSGEKRFILKNPFSSLAVSLSIVLLITYILGSKEAFKKRGHFDYSIGF